MNSLHGENENEVNLWMDDNLSNFYVNKRNSMEYGGGRKDFWNYE
jgi:hypothetical protein